MQEKIYSPLILNIALVLWIIGAPLHSSAQYENKWVFGDRVGINFTSGTPVPFVFNNTTAALQPSIEADASVCDNSGNLLFYTDGSYIFDRQQSLMPNGNNLTGLPSFAISGNISPTSSSCQGTIIIPMINDAQKYFVFSITSNEMGVNFGRLYYSVVDMGLNNGMGDVVTGQKGVFVTDSLAEQMSAVAACGKVWLLVKNRFTHQLKVYKITSAGLEATPLLYNIVPPNTNTGSIVTGSITISNNKNKIAIVGGDLGLQLFDFNVATGIISNQQNIDPVASASICFSPDDSKLYLNSNQTIYQYDLSLGNATAILNSKIAVATASSYSIKLAPNNKIYFAGQSSLPASNIPYLSCIQSPNLPGLACQPQINAVTLVSGTYMKSGLPNVVPIFKKDTVASVSLINQCATILDISATDTTGSGYVWNDGFNTKVRNVINSGTYWVRYQTSCGLRIDTFTVQLRKPVLNQITKVICRNETYHFNGEDYSTAGIYQDTFQASNGCDSVVVLDLVTIPPQTIELKNVPSSGLCMGDTVQLEASGAYYYLWYANNDSLGSGNSMSVRLPLATNEVTLVGISDNNCRDTIQKVITTQACCEVFIPNAFTPNGDGLNDEFGAIPVGNVQQYMLNIYNRWGERIFTSLKVDQKWDGYYKGLPADAGTYHFQLKSTCFEGTESYKKGDLLLIR